FPSRGEAPRTSARMWPIAGCSSRMPTGSGSRKLAVALSCYTLRNIRPHLLALSQIAWDTMIHDRTGLGAAPPGVPQVPWDRGLLAALGTLHTSAWDALAEAERRYHRAA